MAQLALTLAGGWAGGAIAGGFGRAVGSLVGADLGAIVEQELFGPERDAREVAKNGRVSDIRISGSAYGEPIPTVWGRARLPTNLIWVRGIKEKVVTTSETVEGGGKGGGGGDQTVTNKSFRYYADIALGLCEGPITSVYRIWVDNQPLDPEHVAALRIHYGGVNQQPDPLIQAVKGPTGDQAGSTVFTNAGGSLKPWSPVHVSGVRNPSGDLAIAWVRRTRYGGWWLDNADVPLNEESERYEVDILDGLTVVRTLAVTSPSATYSAAQQTADFGAPQSSVAVKIYQLSAVVGRGWPASATL